jgi:hypothetical protein
MSASTTLDLPRMRGATKQSLEKDSMRRCSRKYEGQCDFRLLIPDAEQLLPLYAGS